EAALGTVFIIAANSALRGLGRTISRQPLDTLQRDIRHVVHLITDKQDRERALSILSDLLKTKNIRLGKIDTKPFGDDEVEIQASIDVKGISEEEISDFIRILNQTAVIRHAFWLPRAHQ